MTKTEKKSPRQVLKEIETLFGKYFEIRDWQGFRIILAASCAHHLKGEMLWLRVTSASGSGRTELVNALSDNPYSTEMETLTPASIRGGLRKGAKLLERINGKLVITKDLAAMTATRKDIRQEILGLLRNVKDGRLSSDFGTLEGHISQKVFFDWIISTTAIHESQRWLESMLGERFVDLRWIPGNRLKMAYKAGRNNPHLAEIREKLRQRVRVLMIRAKKVARAVPPRIEEKEMRKIARWADALAICRSPLNVNAYTKHLESMPNPEVGTRLTQDFSRIVRGLKLLGIEDWQPYIQRLVWDCIPSIRAAILKELQDEPQTPKSLSKKTRIPLKTVYYYLEQLRALNVVKRIRAKYPNVSKSGEIKSNGDKGEGGRKYRLKVSLPPFSNKC